MTQWAKEEAELEMEVYDDEAYVASFDISFVVSRRFRIGSGIEFVRSFLYCDCFCVLSS